MSVQTRFRSLRAGMILVVPVLALAIFGVEAANTPFSNELDVAALPAGELGQRDIAGSLTSAAPSRVVDEASFEETAVRRIAPRIIVPSTPPKSKVLGPSTPPVKRISVHRR